MENSQRFAHRHVSAIMMLSFLLVGFSGLVAINDDYDVKAYAGIDFDNDDIAGFRYGLMSNESKVYNQNNALRKDELVLLLDDVLDDINLFRGVNSKNTKTAALYLTGKLSPEDNAVKQQAKYSIYPRQNNNDDARSNLDSVNRLKRNVADNLAKLESRNLDYELVIAPYQFNNEDWE